MTWSTEPIQLTLMPPPVTRTNICQVRIDGRMICADPWEYEVEIGCAHEHVGRGHLCGRHLRYLLTNHARCETCRRDFNHTCYLGYQKVERA
jgi:hypothetical protein